MAQFPVSDLLDGTRSISINMQGSKAEVKLFNKNNPLAPRVADDYEPRNTSTRDHYLPQMIHPNSQEGFAQGTVRNIIEQSIIISSTLDAELQITFGVTYTSGWGLRISRNTLWDMPAGDSNTKYALLAPETGVVLPDTTTHTKVFELPELRQPYPAFFIGFRPLTEPTTGEIQMLVCRRF